jgi:hypothetical protein
MSALPFSWSVSDGKRIKNGVSRLRATVCRAADGKFLISAVVERKVSAEGDPAALKNGNAGGPLL